jgi:predicted butyrate kinase (DUF1464 family)
MELTPVEKIPQPQLQEWIKRQQTCLCSFKALATDADRSNYLMLMQLLGKRMFQNAALARSYFCPQTLLMPLLPGWSLLEHIQLGTPSSLLTTSVP